VDPCVLTFPWQFFLSISLMEGKPLQQAVGVVRDKFVPTMIANYMVRACVRACMRVRCEGRAHAPVCGRRSVESKGVGGNMQLPCAEVVQLNPAFARWSF
jgi:hypothetical protein